MENLDMLVDKLIKLPNEISWVEFKHNNYCPDMIGEDISALANAAAYYEKTCAYMIWGIDDDTHEIVGTTYDQYSLKVGNQEIESWLRNLLSKNASFVFHSLEINNKRVVLLMINRAVNQTVTFKKVDYIRVGSYTKKLNDYPSMKTQLWDRIRNTNFEELIAEKDLDVQGVIEKMDIYSYFELRKMPLPTTQDEIIHYLLEEKMVIKQDNGMFDITNLGAILFAKKLSDFHGLSRKAIRVVQYERNDRLNILKEFSGSKGYANGFEGLIGFLEAILPSSEEINGAIRKTKKEFPIVAVREIVANALIHQDLSISGTGPMIEIFPNRIEVTNPGVPLVDIKRIIDNPPKSRNEKIAALMRRFGMCEELGSGWDRIVISCELETLPAPKIILYEENTKVILFSDIAFANMSMEDKIWDCYLHACIKYVSSETITNSSLRNRFGLQDSSSASISRLIKDTLNEGLIKAVDANTAPRYMKYIPYWA